MYTASIHLKDDSGTGNLGLRYFVDDNGTFAINESSSATNAKWYVEKVTHFNVQPEVELNGKWYTTLKVPFAFTLSGSVEKAYAITANSAGVLQYQEITGTIPAGTPVLLQCGRRSETKHPARDQFLEVHARLHHGMPTGVQDLSLML